jgi:hypothetical protein
VLQKSTGTPGPWYRRHAFGIAAASLGGIAILIAFWIQFGGEREITRVPDLRVTIPFLLVTAGLAVTAFVRRERLRALPIAGLALATSACVLGWLIIVAAVAAAAVIAILIIAKMT